MEENNMLLQGTRCPMWVKGFWLETVVLLLSAEMSELIWLLFPPLCSPSSQPQCLRRWGWNQKQRPGNGLLCSWPHSGARTDWAQETGFSTTEQILPLIRNGHGRKNLSQSATGLDIANNFSPWFLQDLCQGFFQLHTASIILPLYLKKLAAIILKRNVTRAKRVISLNEIRHQ